MAHIVSFEKKEEKNYNNSAYPSDAKHDHFL